uniref:Carboxyl-terminal processing protease n=1 Tax=Candidatus Kentrum sp. DK TaxID=2126562 RepID=A0A450SK35_9GAMM|nr:MAG: carboxyl-terminal processing protease [Candidatus Kentron sp. DK]
MYRTVLSLFLLVLTLSFPVFPVSAFSLPEDSASLSPEPRHARITELVVKLVTEYHYRKKALDDALSASILKHYIEGLDPNRSFFLDKDVERIDARYGDRLDDALRSADITPAFEIFRTYEKRVADRVRMAIHLLSGDHGKALGGAIPVRETFDFTVDENYIPDRSERPWALSAAGLNRIWRKRVKNDYLVLLLEGEKSDAEIRETLQKRYETTLRHVGQFTADDICQLFLNAYAMSIGPHTSYLSPSNSENLFIHLSLSLEGIGAVLQSDNEYTLVREIIPGGPADKSGELHEDDRITGVGQERVGEMVDVVGWRLQDVVNLIRGPKDSVVRLKILPAKIGPDGRSREITLVRNRIDLADRAASASVIDIPSGDGAIPIGVIKLPTFYAQVRASNSGSGNKRSTTRDVARLIGELKQKSVAGLILDLRGNSGGSLEEAVNLTGLFLKSGPVVQIKKSNGEFTVKRDRTPGMTWSGPLVVLVDRGSASASEIFAGAIQDYERGVIVGEITHGKGTVQHLIGLDDVARFSGAGNLGQLKLTIAQFFRVNGESTQYRGVIPDIVLPAVPDPDREGERALENALPWAFVSPAKFSSYPPLDKIIALVRTRHDWRVDQDPVFGVLDQELAAREAIRAQTSLSLLMSKRQAERKSREEAHKRREEQLRLAMGSRKGVDVGKEEDGEDEKPDALILEVLLRETANILVDVINTGHRSTILATDDSTGAW